MKKQTSFLRLSCLFTLVLAGSLSHSQARSLTEIRSSGTLRVGISNNVPPFQWKAGDTPVGFEIDAVRAIASDMGLTVKFKEYPVIPNLMKALADDEVDTLISTLAVTTTREKGGDFTTPYACLGASIFTSDPNVRTVADLKGKKMGMVTGTAFLSYLQKLEGDKEIIEYPTAEDMMQNFAAGKHNGTIAWKAIIPYANKVYHLNLQDTPVLWSIPVGMLVHEKNSGLRLALNTAIRKMQRDGTFEKLNQKFVQNDTLACKK